MDNDISIRDRILFLHQLISSCYPMDLWEYDADLSPLSSTMNDPSFGAGFIRDLGLDQILREQMALGTRTPFLIEGVYDLVWLCGFEYEGADVVRTWVFGGLFTGSSSSMRLRQLLDSSNIFGSRREQVLKKLEDVPVIPYSIVLQYAQMLHRCLYDTQLSSQDVPIFSTARRSEENREKKDPSVKERHAGVWAAEQLLLKAIREGDMSYPLFLERSMKLSSGVKADFSDPVRSAKNNVLTLLTLVSRAAIEGGLSSELSYSLNDYYAERCEAARSISAIMSLASQLIEDYVSRVHDLRMSEGKSPEILSACDYIRLHLGEPLTISDLASRAGYSDYYFSQKFHKEMGVSVSEYIGEARISRAKDLLRDSGMTLSQIQEEVGFSTRSRFYELFRQKTGCSPAQYRRDPGSGRPD